MSAIGHLVNGNQNREGRIDKVDTDKLNSIVERISGVNPSKLVAEVLGKKAPAESIAEAAPSVPRGAGPAFDLAAHRGNQQTDYLAQKVAQLEKRLAQYEMMDVADNDVVQVGTRPAKGPSNRGNDSTVYARDISSKKLKSKDPGDGKPDRQTSPKTAPEAQMAGERINILGISMNEWREMTGVKPQVVDLTKTPELAESYEDQIDDEAEAAADDEMIEHALWTEFLSERDLTPEDVVALIEAAEEEDDQEVLVAVQDLEDEFVEAVQDLMEKRTKEQQLKGHQAMHLDTNPENAFDAEDFISKMKRMGAMPKGRERKIARNAIKNAPGPNDIENSAQVFFKNKEFIKDSPPEEKAYIKRRHLEVEKAGHKRRSIRATAQAMKLPEDIDALWNDFLEEHGLTCEQFDGLVEAAETDDDLATLRAFQDMFEAIHAPTPEADLFEPGKAPVRVQSLTGPAKDVKPSVKGNFTRLPKKMNTLTKPDDEVGEEFECEAEDDGHPDMSHPGFKKAGWTKAMHKAHLASKKSKSFTKRGR